MQEKTATERLLCQGFLSQTEGKKPDTPEVGTPTSRSGRSFLDSLTSDNADSQDQ